MVKLLWIHLIKTKSILILTLTIGGLFSLVHGQYYYFEAPANLYQQGCSETLLIKATTETNTIGASAGLMRLQFDPTYFSYYTGDLATGLQTYLFNANSSTFFDYTNSLMSPIWISGSNHTILGIDRYNSGTPFKGNALYGTLLFTPKYNPNDYTGNFYIIYNGDTIRTSLSYDGGNIINPSHQAPYLTGQFYVYQQPCVNDTTPPAITLSTPPAGTKQSYLSGIHLTLLENVGDTSVPYVWTGGLPGIGTWTGNTWSLNNQYGINLDTFNIRISGNNTGKYFTGGLFSSGGLLSAVPNGTTWQFYNKNYTLDIDSSKIFDYGIEKPITITGNVRDRNNNLSTFTRTINSPVGPFLIPGSATPSLGANGILATAPIQLGIADDWAGVNSGSILITLSGTNGTSYGPYTFSGSTLNLSGVAGVANLPDYYITISGHIAFPTSGTILVRVYALDMAGTQDTINDYTFNTTPSCADLGCCHSGYIQWRTTPPFLYTGFILNVSGGINPTFTIDGNSGTVNCNTQNQGMNIYKGTESNSGSAIHISFFDSSKLVFSGTSGVKATLSGNTIYLKQTYIPPVCITNCGGGGGGGGGGGSTLTPDDCELPSNLSCANDAGDDLSESYYDNTCCAPESHGSASDCDVSDSMYNQEMTDAFSRGYGLNITNKCPIDTARLDDYIIRKELAKMMTLFTIQVVGIYPDTDKEGCDQFDDSERLSDEMKFYTKTSCQLSLMGLEPDGTTPKQSFDPEEYVDRAQFGTILSRLIYGDVYNVYTGEEHKFKRYEKHLRALNEADIMKKIQDPLMLERRGRVLIMLERTTAQNLVEQYRMVAPAHNGALTLLENIR